MTVTKMSEEVYTHFGNTLIFAAHSLHDISLVAHFLATMRTLQLMVAVVWPAAEGVTISF